MQCAPKDGNVRLVLDTHIVVSGLPEQLRAAGSDPGSRAEQTPLAAYVLWVYA
jgi:hypothetical protein